MGELKPPIDHGNLDDTVLQLNRSMSHETKFYFATSWRQSQLYWWAGKDSNLRRHKPADLQSAPFGRLGTDPQA
jgi:hypothetical protein